MAISEIDFLSFAQSLDDESEIYQRCAINRAYYAAYHSCLKLYAAQVAEITEKPADLISYLLTRSEPKERQIGYLLLQLKALRRVADYHLQETIYEVDKKTAVLQAEELLAFLESVSH